MTDRRESINKKPKLEESNSENEMFPTVGHQAQQVGDGVEYINASDLRTTGAEDAQGRPVQEIESLCMNCHQQGTTKMLMTYIPNFREVVVMSFQCPHCGHKNSEIQSATAVQEKGVEYDVELVTKEQLGTPVVKSEFSSFKFPQLDVEIPPGPGRITTVDGLLGGMHDDLARDQPVRKHVDPELYEKIEALLQKLTDAAEGRLLPLTFVLIDPSGNSFVETKDGIKHTYKQFQRTPTQVRQMGLAVPPEEDHRNESLAGAVQEENEKLNHGGEFTEEVPQDLREEIQTFQGSCPSCSTEIPTKMKIVNIPHFKDVIIMSSVCHTCGFKSNEVKTGGSIPDKGRKIKLELVEPEDLTRDLLKSETCTMRFPELGLDLVQGTLGGKFTTIEGLLGQVYAQLESRVMESYDMDAEERRRWSAFLARLQTTMEGHMFPLTVEMEDPCAASYIQNVYAPDPDPNMVIEDYERTFEENEELGLNDIKA